MKGIAECLVHKVVGIVGIVSMKRSELSVLGVRRPIAMLFTDVGERHLAVSAVHVFLVCSDGGAPVRWRRLDCGLDFEELCAKRLVDGDVRVGGVASLGGDGCR